MAKKRKASQANRPPAKKAKAARRRKARKVRKSPGISTRITGMVDLVTDVMRDTQRMRKKAAKRAPLDEG